MNNNKKTIQIEDRSFTESEASCSCCTAPPKDDWHVYRVGLVDTDGAYYSYLCGDAEGYCGCLEEILNEQKKMRQHARERQEKADILGELLGDDEDGRWSTMTE